MLIYKKVFDIITNSWVELPFNTDPKDTERVKIDLDEWEKNGRVIRSNKQKSFSDEDNENSNNEEKEDKE